METTRITQISSQFANAIHRSSGSPAHRRNILNYTFDITGFFQVFNHDDRIVENNGTFSIWVAALHFCLRM
jgi:hypothetical protein